MQTFDVRPPAFRSARNDEPNLSSNKQSPPDENFGELMNRALSEKPRELSRDDREGRQNSPHASSPIKQVAKKPLTQDSSKADDAAQAQVATANPNAHPISQATDADPKPDDDGTSEDASDSDSDKGKHATGKSADAAKSATTVPLTLGTALGTPSPAPTPVKAAGKEAKGNSGGGLGAAKQTEAAGDAAVHSDAKNVEAKDSADPAEKALTANDAAAKEPLESKLPSDKAVPATAPDSSADPAGTSAAKQYLTMKKMEKAPKVAGSAEQVLPGNAATGSEQLPMAQKSADAALLHGSEKPGSTITVDSATPVPISPEPTAATATQAALPAMGADSRLRVLERTHDIVALHAMRLNQSASDALHVVVKPGGGVQLSLELRQNEGIIEVSASLHKGDFSHLNQYWPELQQRLEARGVRVGDLGRSENFSDTSNEQFQQPKQQQQQTPDQDPLHAGAFAEFALAGSLREAPALRAARATAYRGWESWA
ncbi:MAG TPA: hypothetical protein VG938_15785 [Verrucomicrobiae bacterium]|jgi:hypothetical protein|nr:hypothetical protein [Verrucomicrobiae bacterium]